MTAAPTSLRERSKLRRRREIQLAAVRLFTEHGYEGATLSDIAAAAEVSARTVSLYFPAKPDLALGHSNDVAARLSETIQQHPDAGFIEIIDRWLSREAESGDPELAAASHAMFAANPQLRALGSEQIATAMRLASASLYRAIGLPREDPMATIVVAAISAAVTEYLAVSARHRPSNELQAVFMARLTAAMGRG
jgi:AcrR family transcriptional regulator